MTRELMTESELVSATSDYFKPPEGSVYAAGLTFQVPAQRLAAGLVIYQAGLQHLQPQYMALVIVPGWLCFCDQAGLREYVAFDEIARIKREEIRTLTLMLPTPDGDLRPVTRHNAAGVTLEVAADGSFTDEIRFACRKPHQADQWHNFLSRARRAFEDGEALSGDLVI